MMIGLVFILLLQLISSGERASDIKETFMAIKRARTLHETDAGILKLGNECCIEKTDDSCWSGL